MAYTSWSVVFGEQPSATKWNILGANDASFNDGSGLNNISNPITAATASHLRLLAGTSRLVKHTAIRQDNTTNTYKDDTVTEYGWGFITGDGASKVLTKTVTFGVAFTTAPTVVVCTAGARVGSDPTQVSDGTTTVHATDSGTLAAPHTITTTNFVASINKYSVDGNTAAVFGSTVRYLFTWAATGDIA